MKEKCPAGEQTASLPGAPVLRQTQRCKPAYLILPAFSWIITKRANEILLAKDVGLCYNH